MCIIRVITYFAEISIIIICYVKRPDTTPSIIYLNALYFAKSSVLYVTYVYFCSEIRYDDEKVNEWLKIIIIRDINKTC